MVIMMQGLETQILEPCFFFFFALLTMFNLLYTTCTHFTETTMTMTMNANQHQTNIRMNGAQDDTCLEPQVHSFFHFFIALLTIFTGVRKPRRRQTLINTKTNRARASRAHRYIFCMVLYIYRLQLYVFVVLHVILFFYSLILHGFGSS